MPEETMSSRERWLAVLHREVPDRIPMGYWATDEASERLMQYLQYDSMEAVYQRLHIDPVFTVSPKYIGPSNRTGHLLPPVGGSKNIDMYGCGFTSVDYGNGVYQEATYHPLAQYTTVEEIEENYVWPSPDWFDYSVLPEQIADKEHYIIQCYGSEPGWKYPHLRGHEQAMMDFLLYPEIARYCLEKIFDLCYELNRRIYDTIPGKVVLSYIAEDFGSQENLLYSPQVIRTFFFPGMKRMIQLAHEAGAFAFHHSDGAIRKILPELIEIGIDILNPIQWRCQGMERQALKHDFGNQVVFHGAMDNQYTLAFGSIQEVQQEVLDNIAMLGQGGGYILAPSHNIQVVSPPENIVAMYATGYEHGWY